MSYSSKINGQCEKLLARSQERVRKGIMYKNKGDMANAERYIEGALSDFRAVAHAKSRLQKLGNCQRIGLESDLNALEMKAAQMPPVLSGISGDLMQTTREIRRAL